MHPTASSCRRRQSSPLSTKPQAQLVNINISAQDNPRSRGGNGDAEWIASTPRRSLSVNPPNTHSVNPVSHTSDDLEPTLISHPALSKKSNMSTCIILPTPALDLQSSPALIHAQDSFTLHRLKYRDDPTLAPALTESQCPWLFATMPLPEPSTTSPVSIDNHMDLDTLCIDPQELHALFNRQFGCEALVNTDIAVWPIFQSNPTDHIALDSDPSLLTTEQLLALTSNSPDPAFMTDSIQTNMAECGGDSIHPEYLSFPPNTADPAIACLNTSSSPHTPTLSTPFPSSSTSSRKRQADAPLDEEDFKKARKRIQNTEAARRSRARKRAELDELRVHLDDARKECDEYKTQVRMLQNERVAWLAREQKLEQRIRELESRLFN